MDVATLSSTTPAVPARPRARQLVTALFFFIAKAVAIVVLPFLVLLRSSVYLYQDRGIPTWLALAAGVALTLGVVTAYGAWISKRLTGKARVALITKWVALPLVLFYCGYSLLYLARVNAKTEGVREYYTSVHPLLRIAVSTLILIDDEIVITDLGRTPADYIAMGLRVNEASLHYRLDGGYVHAMDLRTIGRSAVRNRFTQTYFRLLGFRTLRHVGTADHLHVSLPPP